mmetsp:Transcript_34002/g.59262  ORF Transcript_34002/g.59262 Transcript_34002/m.59262 type:complete len:109 (+) Transcript_34002:2096-2422(+)
MDLRVQIHTCSIVALQAEVDALWAFYVCKAASALVFVQELAIRFRIDVAGDQMKTSHIFQCPTWRVPQISRVPKKLRPKKSPRATSRTSHARKLKSKRPTPNSRLLLK